jgi:hypothetical protein
MQRPARICGPTAAWKGPQLLLLLHAAARPFAKAADA